MLPLLDPLGELPFPPGTLMFLQVTHEQGTILTIGVELPHCLVTIAAVGGLQVGVVTGVLHVVFPGVGQVFGGVTGVLQVAFTGVEQVTFAGVGQVAFTGVEQVAFTGVEQVAFTGVEQVALTGVEQFLGVDAPVGHAGIG